MTSSIQKRSTMITADINRHTDSFARDVDKGLKGFPKRMPCLYFYDYVGSLLFEKICQLPEYYLARTESKILETYAEEIIACLPDDPLLVELGSGSCIKTRYIIEEMLQQYDKVTYSPIDVSRRMLKESAISLLERYEDLEVISVAAEYEEGLRQLDRRSSRPKLILWLGSSIGNLEYPEAGRFLKDIVGRLSSRDYFLIGFDLNKDKDVLEKAYNDSQQVTAEFNLNLLKRINGELGGTFVLDQFLHKAIYNPEEHRIEMYLISRCDQDVTIADLNVTCHFEKDEKIHTENSHKYTLEQIRTIARVAGMTIVNQWFDDKKYFNLTLFQPIS